MSVPHSCECYAYLIEHDDMGRMLFATDCKAFNYKISGLNHVFIESNWDEELVLENLCNEADIRSRYGNHLEIQGTIRALKNNYSPSLQTICLIHLSESNADPSAFVSRIKGELGFENVHYAIKGLEISLQISEF